MSTFQKRLRLLRGKLTQAEFAEENEVPLSTYSRYERGTTAPDLIFLQNICIKYDVSPNWLLFGNGSMHADDPAEKDLSTTQTAAQSIAEPASLVDCQRYARLEAKLEKVEGQRDDLAQENRQLLRENGELKVKVARLEAEVHKPPELGGRYEQSGQTA